jgi:tetratricopeptide (TPR) repeat protein
MELHPDITASNTPSVYDIAKTQNLTGIVEVFEARNDTRETDLDGLKAKADAAYSSKRVSDALAKYALWLITAQAQGGKQPPLAIAKVHSNRSACYVALKDSDSAMREADKCVALAPEWAKGHARRAVALLMRGFMDQSAAAYAQAAAIDRQWARQATASAKEAIARREIDVGKAIKAIISEPIQRRLQERIADDLGTDDAYAEVFAKDIGLGSPMAFPPAGSEARSLLLTHASWVRAMAFSRRVNSMILINNKSDYDRAAAQLAGPADDATAPLRAMLRKVRVRRVAAAA